MSGNDTEPQEFAQVEDSGMSYFVVLVAMVVGVVVLIFVIMLTYRHDSRSGRDRALPKRVVAISDDLDEEEFSPTVTVSFTPGLTHNELKEADYSPLAENPQHLKPPIEFRV
eukprot:TRINITY_DN21435_c0_g1_i1.p1 TRINITY_DN21435_c0_g1~~TRINITY_DN21435_c0_g1_i1.p1  ORF type:complete len:112 (+),score=10.31 TRINITY_DN21435_c0_g1_i1:80-415(+)